LLFTVSVRPSAAQNTSLVEVTNFIHGSLISMAFRPQLSLQWAWEPHSDK